MCIYIIYVYNKTSMCLERSVLKLTKRQEHWIHNWNFDKGVHLNCLGGSTTHME